ncbi:MAG: bacteriohemerythrin [Terriglobales bacterium]
MESVFQWNDRYSVKVQALDNQHKQLFEIINELFAAMRCGHGKDVVADVLQRLVNYTVKHFAAEEKLMDDNKYPSLAAHRIEHKILTDKVLAFKKEFDAGHANISPKLLTFLQNWLTDHIETVDQKYSEFLNSKGIR